MTERTVAGIAATALVVLSGTLAFSQSQSPTQGPAVGSTPAWFLQGSFPDPGGRTIVESGGKVTVPGREGGAGNRGGGAGRGASARGAGVTAPAGVPGCNRSPLCGRRGGLGPVGRDGALGGRRVAGGRGGGGHRSSLPPCLTGAGPARTRATLVAS